MSAPLASLFIAAASPEPLVAVLRAEPPALSYVANDRLSAAKALRLDVDPVAPVVPPPRLPALIRAVFPLPPSLRGLYWRAAACAFVLDRLLFASVDDR